MENYTVLDLETTGLNLAKAEILELALMRVTAGVPAETYAWVLKVSGPLDPEVVRITGITDGMVESLGADPTLTLNIAHQLIGKDLPLVGHNILRFDHPILLRTARQLNLPLKEDLGLDRIVDTAALYKGFKMGIRPPAGVSHLAYASRVLDQRVYGLRYNLAEACKVLGIGTNGLTAHRAAGDVQMTDLVYRKLAELGWGV